MKTLYRLFLTAAFGCLLLPGSAWAGPVWSLQWEFGTNVLVSDTGRSVVTFSPHNTTSSSKATTAVLANIGDASYLAPNKTDHITRQNYGALLKLTDLASGASKYIWFSGSLTGTISQHASSLSNKFLTPTTFTNIHLGKDTYTLRIGPFISPTWSNHFNGALDAYVTYTPPPPKVTNTVVLTDGSSGTRMGAMAFASTNVVNPTPEPSSLLLGGMAMVLCGVPVWRRRRLGSA